MTQSEQIIDYRLAQIEGADNTTTQCVLGGICPQSTDCFSFSSYMGIFGKVLSDTMDYSYEWYLGYPHHASRSPWKQGIIQDLKDEADTFHRG